MTGCRAVLFDLFDTLVHFDRDRLPLIHVNGRSVRSTAGHLHDVFRPHAPDVDLPRFVDALLWSWQEAERLRAVDHREVPASRRFELLFQHLGLEPGVIAPEAVELLLQTHGRELSKASEFPPHHGPLLRRLARDYRLAVVSNFDYTPTARRILDAAGITELLGTIIVSDESGNISRWKCVWHAGRIAKYKLSYFGPRPDPLINGVASLCGRHFLSAYLREPF